MADQEAIVLGGRTFRKASVTSLDQDAYVMKRMRSVGLIDMVATFDPKKDDLNRFSEELLMAAFESGLLYQILGGTLVEDGVTWSRDVAAANAGLFAGLTNNDEKVRLYEGIASILIDFLLSAANWSKTSPKSSASSGEPTSPDVIGAIAGSSGTTTANGTPLSGS